MKERRAMAIGIVLCLVVVLAGGLSSASAEARDLQFPIFSTPGLNPDQSPSTAPGARPYEVISTLAVNQSPANGGLIGPAENIRDVAIELPAGLNAAAARYPRCSGEGFAQSSCAAVTQVGVVELELAGGAPASTVPVFNVDPPGGSAAQFAFRVDGAPVQIDFALRNGGDYGASASVGGLGESAGLLRSTVRIWGVPGDPGHDALRFGGSGVPSPGPYPEAPPFRALLSNPTSCRGPLVTTMRVSTWQHPERLFSAAPFEAPGTDGCDQLEFDPTVEVKPTTNLGDSPSGLDLHLHLPQISDPEGSASAELRDARFDLPAALALNPAGANGLSSCTAAEIGFTGVASERQLLRYDMPPVNFSGTFTVSRAGATTAPISATATSAQVAAALETLPGLAGNVALEGAPGGWIVSFTGALAGTDVPLLSGAVTDNPSQTIAVTAEGGTFKLGLGSASTADLPFDATAAEVQAALRQIPALGLGNLYPGNVFVSGPGIEEDTRTYRVIFANDLNEAKPQLLATSSLSGPGAGVTISPTDPPPARGLSVASFGASAPGTPQFDSAPPGCPDTSQVGTVRVDSPAQLDHPLFGAVYLATPEDNPFGTLLAAYITVSDPASGINVKLPARIDPDPATGALRVSVAEAPQLPFEDLSIELFKGTAAPLRTPTVCATYGVETLLTPSSAPEGASRKPKDTFTIAQGAGGGVCPSAQDKVPDSTHFSAGTLDPSAGVYTPFILRLARPDGSRELHAIDTTLPAGLLGRIAGLGTCPEAALAAAATSSGRSEAGSPSCPASSRVGSLEISAGAGPAPYNLSGSAYLAGPYHGAPLSLALVTPALAGPFDLGTVVLRVALAVDPHTARVTATSDPLPASLRSVPLDLRSVALRLDPGFAKNPTSCYPLTFNGAQDSRFQVGDCRKLGFAPKLALALKGPAERGAHPALALSLTNAGKGTQANLAGLSLALPKALRLDRAHLHSGVYGEATASSPLLDQPLRGPVSVRRTAKSTQLIVALTGQVDLTLEGELRQGKGGSMRVSFESLPDVPIGKLNLSMPGGKKGLFEAVRNLCSRPLRADSEMTGQNAATSDRTIPLKAHCPKAAAKRGRAER